MADFIQDQINETKKQNQQNVNINNETLVSLTNILQDILNQLKSQTKKQDEVKKETINLKDILKNTKNDLYQKIFNSTNFQKLKENTNFENILSSTFNGVKNFADQLKMLEGNIGKFGAMLGTITIAIDQGIKNAIFLERNQIATNQRYLAIRGISSLNQGQFFGTQQNQFERMVETIGKTPDKTYSTEETWQTLMNMNKYYNTAKLSQSALFQRGRDTLRLGNISENLSDMYNQMLGRSQGTRNQVMNSLDMYLAKFEKNSLGLDKSLQQTKQLQDINAKYGFTMNQAAGYVNKFNDQLQKGTLSLQDLTILTSTLKSGSMAQNAGLGQEMLNAGFGTKRLRQAAGNPILTAAIMRNAGNDELEAMQDYFQFLMNSTGFNGTPEERAEMLGFMFQNRAGITLNDEQRKILAKGGKITARALQAPDYNQSSDFSVDYSKLSNTLTSAEQNLTSSVDDISESLKKGKENLLITLNELNGSIGEMASDILNGNLSIKNMTNHLKDAGTAIKNFKDNFTDSKSNQNIKNVLETGDLQ